jgi:hypothetical protein
MTENSIEPTPIPAPEVVTGDSIGAAYESEPGDTAIIASPTQVRKPWRATVRSAFQFLLAALTLIPFVIGGVYESDNYPVVVGQLLAAVTTAARVMALPQVEEFLRRFFPWLSASGPQPLA